VNETTKRAAVRLTGRRRFYLTLVYLEPVRDELRSVEPPELAKTAVPRELLRLVNEQTIPLVLCASDVIVTRPPSERMMLSSSAEG
jgi:hypothetical protein